MFKWFRVGWLLFGLLLLVPARPALATEPCPQITPDQAFQGAEAVLFGRLYKVETTEALVHTIVAERVYKGDPPTPISARYTGLSATSPYKEGQLYTFYLDKDEKGKWLLFHCNPNHEAQPTAAEAALFGEGRAPNPPDTSRLWIPIVAMSVAVGGVGVVLLRNRFGRRPS